MGKKGKRSDGNKQEVISMANLEVVSEESFQRRLEGMSSCLHCIKERSKGSDLPSSNSGNGGGDHVRGHNNTNNNNKSRKRRRSNKAKSNRIIPRASSPIVVHLEDSIKVSSKNTKSTVKSPLAIDSNEITAMSKIDTGRPGAQTNDSGTLTEPSNSINNHYGHHNSSYRKSGKETIVSLNNTQYYSGRATNNNHQQPHHQGSSPSHYPHSLHRHHHHTRHRGCHHRLSCSNKNFNAFLSAIERVHQKDPRSTSTKLENLVEYAREKKDKFGLNNTVNYCRQQKSSSLFGVNGESRKLKSHLHLLNEKNVELICNNLSRKSSLTESEEGETTASEDISSSSVTSNSSSSTCSSSEDTESDCAASSSESEELTQEEVRYLAEFVSGFSLTKYDCAPDECPECLAAYYDFVSQCTTPTNYGSDQSDSYSDSDSENDSEIDAQVATEELYPVVVKSSGKVEISVAKLLKSTVSRKSLSRSRSKKNHRLSKVSTPPSGVYVDLEDSEVSVTIEYHPDTSSRRSRDRHAHHRLSTSSTSSSSSVGSDEFQQSYHSHQQQPWSVPSFWDWFYYPLGTYGWLPYSLPYCLVPMYYLPYPLYATVPKPLVVPRDTPCLKSQRLCLVPAQEVKNFTASQPPQRPWIPLSHPERNKPIALYTVMCYNVLCDKYATRQLYGYCPSWALNWEYRKKGIIEEIRHYSADIISLQEVETDQFYNFFLPELKRDGYDGIFSPKSRARTMTESERKHVDGCAIFYRTAKFSLIKEHLVEFNQLAMTAADGSHDMLNRVMTKDNIGLAALFETKEAIWENGLPADGQVNQPILVATCHVHWDPEFSDVKLIQTMMLMSELKNILDETQTSFRPGSTTAPDVNNIPLILCGDLNSLPNSGVLEFLTTSKVAATHEDFKDLGYDACLQKMTTSDHKDFYTHSFKMAPAYTKDMIPYTNYTYDFKGVIDYIFYTRDLMRPLGVLGPLDENWFSENKVLGCPHPHIPSDHLPLLVELEMQLPSVSGNNQRSNSSLITAVRR